MGRGTLRLGLCFHPLPCLRLGFRLGGLLVRYLLLFFVLTTGYTSQHHKTDHDARNNQAPFVHHTIAPRLILYLPYLIV